MSNENKSVDYSHFDENQNKEKYYDGYNIHSSSSQYKELYTNTSRKNNAKTIIGQHFVKDLTKPFTYYSFQTKHMKMHINTMRAIVTIILIINPVLKMMDV